MIPARIPRALGAFSGAAAVRLSIAASIALLALAACSRPGSASGAQAALESSGGTAGAMEAPAPGKLGAPGVSSASGQSSAPGKPGASGVSADERAGAASPGPLALQAATDKASKPPAVQAAPSLAGHDRFLALGDGPPIPAADFLIGPLASSAEDGRLAPLALLRDGIAKRELDPKAFSGSSWRISSLVFADAYSKAKPVQELRLGMPSASEGGLALRFRLLGGELSALGQAMLYDDAEGGWLIEHFELDKDALSSPRQALEGWEPPLALYP